MPPFVRGESSVAADDVIPLGLFTFADRIDLPADSSENDGLRENVTKTSFNQERIIRTTLLMVIMEIG